MLKQVQAQKAVSLYKTAHIGPSIPEVNAWQASLLTITPLFCKLYLKVFEN
jgi:hypothetical protein